MPKLVRNLLNYFNSTVIKNSLFVARFDYINNVVTVRQQAIPELGRSVIDTKIFAQEDTDASVVSTLKN